jgi:3-phenylpropionate/trans-cinnamate dioxygenase ferredoxin component
MTWVRVAEISTTEVGRALVVEAGGNRIALCTTAEGHYAIDDVCSHDGGALDQGELDGLTIECPRHGALFDVTTGAAKTLPAVRGVSSYATRTVDGFVEVEVPA